MAAAQDVLLPKEILDEFRRVFVGKLDEKTLAQAVEELKEILKATAEDGDTALECEFTDATQLPRLAIQMNASVRMKELNLHRPKPIVGGMIFSGKNAEGEGEGTGLLKILSSKIDADTTSYAINSLNNCVFLDTIVFKNASNKTLGIWMGKFFSKVPASSGPGHWHV